MAYGSLVFSQTSNPQSAVIMAQPGGVNPIVQGDFTMSMWIKLNVSGQTQYTLFVEAHGGITIYLDGSNNNRFTWKSVQGVAGSNTNLTNDGLWHHVALTYDDTAHIVSFYLDGVLDITENPGTLNIAAGGNAPTVGADNPTGGAAGFEGKIADFRLYQRKLSGSEISTLNSGGNPSATNFIMEYDFHEGSGTTAHDIQEATWDGTLTNQGNNAITWDTDIPAVLAGQTFHQSLSDSVTDTDSKVFKDSKALTDTL